MKSHIASSLAGVHGLGRRMLHHLSEVQRRHHEDLKYVYLIVHIVCSYHSRNLNAYKSLLSLDQDIKLGHVYSAIGICSVPLFLIAGAGSAVFWIIGMNIFSFSLESNAVR